MTLRDQLLATAWRALKGALMIVGAIHVLASLMGVAPDCAAA